MDNADAAQAETKSDRTSITVLQSWEEIAHYLQGSVRTVQRWERAAALPVHHLRDSGRGPVFAFRNELDQWSQQRLRREFD